MVLVHRHILLIEQLTSLFLEKHHFLPLKFVDWLLPANAMRGDNHWTWLPWSSKVVKRNLKPCHLGNRSNECRLISEGIETWTSCCPTVPAWLVGLPVQISTIVVMNARCWLNFQKKKYLNESYNGIVCLWSWKELFAPHIKSNGLSSFRTSIISEGENKVNCDQPAQFWLQSSVVTGFRILALCDLQDL